MMNQEGNADEIIQTTLILKKQSIIKIKFNKSIKDNTLTNILLNYKKNNTENDTINQTSSDIKKPKGIIETKVIKEIKETDISSDNLKTYILTGKCNHDKEWKLDNQCIICSCIIEDLNYDSIPIKYKSA